MTTLYIVSSEAAAGKTAIAAGLGKRLLADGKKVGYFRPSIAGEANPADGARDAAFIKRVLDLPEAIESLCPPTGEGPVDGVKEALARISPGRDVVIAEGLLRADSQQIAEALNARVIVVEDYSGKSVPDGSYKGFGDDLLGIIVNKVPKSRMKRAQEEARARCTIAGVTLLGLLPEDRVLLAPTIGELAECIQGKILSNADKSDELVEDLLVGALSVDSGLLYFGRKANKAAITRVDRPDMQLAVLETPTKCLVISGSTTPIYYRVVEKAGAKGIPLVQTDNDTNTILARIEATLSRARFAQEKKLPRLGEILKQSVDFKVLYRGLGLAS